MAYLSDLKFLNRGSSYMEWDDESNDRPLNEELEQDAQQNAWPNWKAPWNRMSTLSIMKQSWRRRRRSLTSQ